MMLAILMGGGLVFFGIGGNTSGGLFDAFKSGGGGGGSDVFSKQATQAEKTLKLNPNDASAWAVLARARFQPAAGVPPRATYAPASPTCAWSSSMTPATTYRKRRPRRWGIRSCAAATA